MTETNYIKVSNLDEKTLPSRVYRLQVQIEIPAQNLPNLERLLEYFIGRLKTRQDIESLFIKKGLISEDQSDFVMFVSFGRSEAGTSIWTAWKTIEEQLAAIGKPKLLNVYVQAPQLPVNLGQPSLATAIKRFLYDWAPMIELVLLGVVIAILLSQKQE